MWNFFHYMHRLAKQFWYEGLKYANHNSINSIGTGLRRYRTFYGITPNVFAELWKIIAEKPQGSEPKHLLWCLFFLKNYNKEHVNARGIFHYLKLHSKVKCENRLKNSNGNMHVTLDGTGCRIREPMPFSKKWYSHKFKSAGVRYEIGISIVEAEVVWASGGVPCGERPDIKLAKELYLHFAKNGVTLADKGYKLAGKFKQPSNSREKRLLAWHETLNGRLKQFSILSERFRHPLNKHPLVFHAVLNIVQISIMKGEKLFDM